MVAGMPSSGRKLPRAVPPRRDGTGLPELHEAAVFGEVGRARKALAQGDHIDVKGSDGGTPIYASCKNGWPECVKFLLENGADKDMPEDRNLCTPVWIACRNEHPECLKVLLEAGADKEKTNKYGETPLYIACSYGNAECVQILVDAGADVNKASDQGVTPLYMSSDRVWPKCVKILLDAGADKEKANATASYTPDYVKAEKKLAQWVENDRIRYAAGAASRPAPAPSPYQ